MKLVTFNDGERVKFGAFTPQGITDLTARLGEDVTDIKTLLQKNLLNQAARIASEDQPTHQIADICLLPPLHNPGKIFCIGLNYQEHKEETGRPDSDYPTVFTRYAQSLVGHGGTMRCPPESYRYDYEGELAVIIGKAGRRIAEEDALTHIAGYSCFNDGTIRDWQGHTSQFIPGKNFTESGAFGPWLITADDIPDYTILPIETRLNGAVMQKASLSDLIFPIPRLIAYLSSFISLEPGDVIATGTPGGVGFRRKPPLYLKAGDKVEVDIGPVGLLVNTVENEALAVKP